jgi:hypothetical protein
MRSALTCCVVALVALAACATPNLDEPEPPPSEKPPAASGSGKSPTSPSPSSSGTGAPAPAPAPDPGDSSGRGARRWTGSLAATTPLQFGGGQACVYRITLKDVKVEISAAGNGDILTAGVTATAFEETLSANCNTPIPINAHTYVLTGASVLPNGTVHISLAASAPNNPHASLVIEGDLRTAYPELSLAWHRSDQGPPLDWRVSTKVTVALQ